MSKTILYRLFGVGKIPAQYDVTMKNEGLVLSDEGIRGSTTYRNFRSPRRRSNWRREWHSSSIVLTNARLLAFNRSNRIINVPLTDERFQRLRFSIEGEHTLLVAFDASLFHDDWSGTIEYRFKTPHARAFLNKIKG